MHFHAENGDILHWVLKYKVNQPSIYAWKSGGLKPIGWHRSLKSGGSFDPLDPVLPRSMQQPSTIFGPCLLVAKRPPISATELSTCCTAHSIASLYFTMGCPFPLPQNCPFSRWDLDPHTWFLGPIESSTQMSDDVLLGDWCDVLGSVAFSRKHPLACWVSSMLMCFATSIVSNFLVGESLVIPLKNHQEIIVATAVWYDLLPAVIIKLRG